MGYNTGGVERDYVQLTAYQKSLLQSVRMDGHARSSSTLAC